MFRWFRYGSYVVKTLIHFDDMDMKGDSVAYAQRLIVLGKKNKKKLGSGITR